MATSDQIIPYFFLLTKNHFEQEFGSDQGKRMSKKFEKRFNELFKQNSDKMSDDLSNFHGINPIFVMALDDTLKEQNVSFEDLKSHVLGIYEIMLQELLNKQQQQLESSETPWETYVEAAKSGNKQFYDNKYFQLKVVQDNDQEFGFDIQRCFYFEFFKDNDRPGLGPILCEYDYILARNVEKWVKFERTETIADGDSCCNFRFFRK